MNPWLLLFLWVGAAALQLAFGALALRQRPVGSNAWGERALALSGAAAVVPLLTLLLVILVFVVGGSSNVAQLAGESGWHLWRLWHRIYVLLYLGNPLSFLMAAVAVVIPPYPPGQWSSFVSRMGGVIAAGFAWYVVVSLPPDA